uniref:Uncharacterized protein n=1 Tax=viral metagenome TaxID=1070528 RepID=A0A6C0II03_9ZZZZ
MALYNRFIESYDSATNGGKEDFYHGEDDNQDYGNLYIPYIEAELASLARVRQVFNANKIGMVTSAIFTELQTPASYKGKNKKQVFSAVIYIKWNDTPTVLAFRESIMNGDKENSRIHINKGKNVHWIVRQNTAIIPEELLAERYITADLAETATDVAWRSLQSDMGEEELEEIAIAVAMNVLC